jgi:hypothetical protein
MVQNTDVSLHSVAKGDKAGGGGESHWRVTFRVVYDSVEFTIPVWLRVGTVPEKDVVGAARATLHDILRAAADAAKQSETI